ncbi:hypothetical protein L195_g037235 [Trifolium pratense]|uniref:Uncharacterized protein n=1 Tax=Trifolium pratense TaxID=57577 RepID=A0A2K3LRQ5_TRIPR|nr:hypothetical protein L195_g037235 [Trifolium pratense]
MALASSWNMNMGVLGSTNKTMSFEISCSSRKRDRDRDKERGSNSIHPPYKVVEITPPPKSLGVRCLPPVLEPFQDPWTTCFQVSAIELSTVYIHAPNSIVLGVLTVKSFTSDMG